MSLTILFVLSRTLWRDRVGLLMTFLLPPMIFIVFAEIFSATGQNTPDIKLGVLSLVDDPSMDRLIASIDVVERQEFRTESTLLLALTSGAIDAGVVVEDRQETPNSNAIRVLSDPSRPLAGAVVHRQLSENFAAVAPSAYFNRERQVWTTLVGDLTVDQSKRLDAVVRGERQVLLPPALVEVEVGTNPRGADPAVSYYAGAIGIMFIFFSSMNGASGLIEERNSGVFDRYMSFGKGIGFLIRGRAYFLILQGFFQLLVIFTVALWLYDVDWLANSFVWALIALVSAFCVASLGLLLASVCSTRAQMQTLSTFAVLVISALGGSMVPLYLMPNWLRWVGGFTPTAWSIELFDGVFTRGLPLVELAPQLISLASTAVIAFAAALVITKRKLVL